MLTANYNNTLFGQNIATGYELLSNVLVLMGDKQIVFNDIVTGSPQVRMYMNDGIISYQTYNSTTQTWNSEQSLTPDFQIPNSNTVPAIPGSSYLQITDSILKVVMLNDTKLLYNGPGNSLNITLDTIQIHNLVNNLNILADFSSGKQVVLRDSYTNQIQLSIDTTNMNLYSKPVIGLMTSADPTSAVTLSQLISLIPNYLKFDIGNQSIVFNQSDIPVVVFDNSGVNSQIPFHYSTRPLVFGNQDLPDVQYVLQNTLAQSTTLDQISLANPTSGDIDMQSHNIVKVGQIDSTPTGTLVLNNQFQDTQLVIGTTNMTMDFPNGGTPVTLNLNPQPDSSLSIRCDSAAAIDALTSQLKVSGTEIKGYISDANLGPQVSLSNKLYIKNCPLDVYGNNIQNVADPIGANDAFGKTYADNRYYLNTVSLNNITAPTGSVSLNSQKIINLLNPTLAQDAVTLNYLQTNNYTKTQTTDLTVNSFAAPTASFSMNSQKIINLGNATLGTDAVNLNTGDGRYYLNTTVLSSITAPTASLSLNSQKIINLGNATLATDALNRQTADGRYYLNTTTLNTITAPIASVSLNSQKITNLGNATLGTDAVNLNTGDSRYYLNTTVLSSITAPTASVSLNSQKITNLATGVAPNDAVNVAQLNAVQWGPIGSMIMYASSTIPANWLECNGAAISRTTYATLFATIGTTWGNGNGLTTFNLPETRGLFPRGWNHASSRSAPYNDPDAASRVASNAGGATGDNVGTLQADMFENHSHSFSYTDSYPLTTTEAIWAPLDTNRTYSYGASTQSLSSTTNSNGGNENRPVNFAIVFIIKYQ